MSQGLASLSHTQEEDEEHDGDAGDQDLETSATRDIDDTEEDGDNVGTSSEL